jgi:hypothetical protein
MYCFSSLILLYCVVWFVYVCIFFCGYEMPDTLHSGNLIIDYALNMFSFIHFYTAHCENCLHKKSEYHIMAHWSALESFIKNKI